MPGFFLHDEKPVDDYFDEPALRKCVRSAVQLAGRSYYEEITRSAEDYKEWRKWVEENGVEANWRWKSADDNRDGNTVDGLTDKVISSALEKEPSLDRNTKDKTTCAALVNIFAGSHQLDEIIRAWGRKVGIFMEYRSWNGTGPLPGHEGSSLPLIERRHMAAYVATTYGNRTGQIVVPGNSTRPSLAIEVDENDFPLSVTVPEKEISIHFKWGALSNFTIGKSHVPNWPVLMTELERGPASGQPEDAGRRAANSSAEDPTLLARSTRPFNSTRQPAYWVPVPAVNLTSRPGSSLNYTDRFANSAGVGLDSWGWEPIAGIPISRNASHNEWMVSAGVPEFVKAARGIISASTNSTSKAHSARPRRSTTPGGLSVPWPPKDFPEIPYIPGHDIAVPLADFEKMMLILDRSDNLTTHGNSTGPLSSRDPVDYVDLGMDALRRLLGKVFTVIRHVREQAAARKGEKTPNGRRVARGSMGSS